MIQIHRLEGFYWVARTGGYARAARSFPYPITQPAVHQQVKKLEVELGLALFERVSKDQVKLTAAGRSLFDFAEPFFEGLESVLRALQSGGQGGEMIIHAETLLVRGLLPDWLSKVLGQRPDARLDLHEIRRPNIDALRRGLADVLVAYLPDTPADVASIEIAELRPFLVAPRTTVSPKENDTVRRTSPRKLSSRITTTCCPTSYK